MTLNSVPHDCLLPLEDPGLMILSFVNFFCVLGCKNSGQSPVL